MELTASQIESIVRQVLAGAIAAPAASGAPATGKAKGAVLTAPRKIEIQEVDIPELGDDDILVKVEGAGVCGTDVHEWKGDPFGMCPVILGHEGTGEVIALGKNVTCDTAGKPLKVGDKIVTSVISCGECHVCRMHPGNTNLCDKQGIFGLMPQNKENPPQRLVRYPPAHPRKGRYLFPGQRPGRQAKNDPGGRLRLRTRRRSRSVHRSSQLQR